MSRERNSLIFAVCMVAVLTFLYVMRRDNGVSNSPVQAVPTESAAQTSPPVQQLTRERRHSEPPLQEQPSNADSPVSSPQENVQEPSPVVPPPPPPPPQPVETFFPISPNSPSNSGLECHDSLVSVEQVSRIGQYLKIYYRVLGLQAEGMGQRAASPEWDYVIDRTTGMRHEALFQPNPGTKLEPQEVTRNVVTYGNFDSNPQDLTIYYGCEFGRPILGAFIRHYSPIQLEVILEAPQ
jgi:hypothetical protein